MAHHSSKGEVIQTFLQCNQCEGVQSIHRRKGKKKPKNHVKHLYCITCRDRTAHIEVKEDVFLPDWLKYNEEDDE